MAVTTRISTSSDGTQVSFQSIDPVFSPGGTKVLFQSSADNLVSGDNNSSADIFVKDLVTGTVTRVSTAADGTEANNFSSNAVFSPDGSKVVFQSRASNLVANDSNNTDDIFVKDLATGAVTRISTAADGTEANSFSYRPVISPDGGKVMFYSYADNLVGTDTNNNFDIFVKDLASGAVTLVSANVDGMQGNNISTIPDFNPVFSPDSASIAFRSDASNLIASDTNGLADIFVKSLGPGGVGGVILASCAADGTQANGESFNPTFSPDGTKLAFQSSATNLVAHDDNGRNDIFVKDLATGAVTLVSTAADGTQGNGSSYGKPAFSPDGTKIVFQSFASNLVLDDSNGNADIFVKDLVTGAVTRVSVATGGGQGNGDSLTPVFSPDSTKIMFQSSASNLVADDTNGAKDIFIITLDAIARDDAFTAAENAVATGNVFDDNGSGADSGGALSMVAVNGASGSVGKTITLESGATLMLKADGSFRYDPNHAFDELPAARSGAANSTATDSFTYTLDGGDTATVTLTVKGIDSSDTVHGTRVAETLKAGKGNDTIFGALGTDDLSGGAGRDMFVFDTRLGPANVDTITDFVVRDDTIWLDRTIFSKAGKIGDLAERAFFVGTQAHDTSDRIIYDKAHGILLYDADGKGGKHGIVFAEVSDGLKLTVADFDIIA